MFESFEDYFSAVLAHYGSPYPVDLIHQDTQMSKEQIIAELVKRKLAFKEFGPVV